MSKEALAVLSPGSEEMELVITVDTLRRAGIKVTVGGLLNADNVTCSRDIVIKPDISLTEAAKKSYDIIILPGGLPGTKAMIANELLGDLLKQQQTNDKLIAAICAAPLALQAHGIGFGKSITSYPGVKGDLTSNYKYVDDQLVVQDGKLITSKGPATAMIFALKLIEVLVSVEKAQEVGKALLLNSSYKLD